MLLEFEIIQDIAIGTNPIAIHNIDNTAIVSYVSENGQMKGIETSTPLGEWSNRIFKMPSRISGETNLQSLHTKTIPRYKNVFVWYADGVHRIATDPDSSPLNTSDDPYRLFYGIDSEKLYMNIAQHWEFIATTNHAEMKGLSEDSHLQYLTSTRHALEPHQDLKDEIESLQGDVEKIKETPPGTTDLTDYYHKSEIDSKLEALASQDPVAELQYLNWSTIGTYSIFNIVTKSLSRTNIDIGYDSGGYGTTAIKNKIIFEIKATGGVRCGLVYDYTKNNASTDADGRIFDFFIMVSMLNNAVSFYEGAAAVGQIELATIPIIITFEILEDRTVRVYYGDVLIYTFLTKASNAPLYPKCRFWSASEISNTKFS